MEQFEAFAARHGITLTAQHIPARTDGFGQDNGDRPAPVHFHVILTMGNRTLWSGEYSVGIGHAEAYARENLNRCRAIGGAKFVDQVRHPLPYGKRYLPSADYWTHCRALYVRAVERQGKPDGPKRTYPYVLTAAEILLSLQMDVASSDQPFPDWAADYGYSDDSIKARKVWEACNDTRRALQSALGDAWAEFEGLEE